MFRDMRRDAQQLSAQDADAVLSRCQNGVLACAGDAGYPYAVPLNFVYFAGRIYFHTAKAGHKMDAFAAKPKVSFAVIDQDSIVSPE
ncbi:MAG: 5-nitroimidazole antibiotic resistance protein, partial [Clostridiaceae bacterium]|nr:5-nitroimidazole antibiotic resistance protein [Clostridiaceae bacterium]